VLTQVATISAKAQVWGKNNWFVPENVSFNAIPRALTLMTCKISYYQIKDGILSEFSVENHQGKLCLSTKMWGDANRKRSQKRTHCNVHHDVWLPMIRYNIIYKYQGCCNYYSCIAKKSCKKQGTNNEQI
jgi:hypothetical protein